MISGIDLDVLQTSNISLCEKLSQTYPNHRVQKQLKIFLKDLQQ